MADVDERQTISLFGRAPWPHAPVGSRNGQGRDVSGMPMVLMAGMKDRAQIRLKSRSDERSAVHDLGYVFQAFGDLQPVHVGVNRGKGAEDLAHVQAHLERMVSRWIEGVGSGHPRNQIGMQESALARMLDRLVGPSLRSFGRKSSCGSHTQLLDEISADDGFGKIHGA